VNSKLTQFHHFIFGNDILDQPKPFRSAPLFCLLTVPQRKKKIFDLSKLDNGIRPAVEILISHGFETIESCEGGNGHAFPDPTVKFLGSEFDLIRAYEVCECYNLNVLAVRRVYTKSEVYSQDNTKKAHAIGLAFERPTNEIVFVKHLKTGTIFRPC